MQKTQAEAPASKLFSEFVILDHNPGAENQTVNRIPY